MDPKEIRQWVQLKIGLGQCMWGAKFLLHTEGKEEYSCKRLGSKGNKESTCSAGDLGLILRLGRSPGEGKDHPLQYSGLENSMGCIVHGVTKSWI